MRIVAAKDAGIEPVTATSAAYCRALPMSQKNVWLVVLNTVIGQLTTTGYYCNYYPLFYLPQNVLLLLP